MSRSVGVVHGSALLVALAAAGCQDPSLAPSPERSKSSVGPSSTTRSLVDEVDLLLMIDDSPSMADAQAILAAAVPDLVERLVDPRCVDSKGAPTGHAIEPATSLCPVGERREFAPVQSLHVGVVTSSLGGAGADACSDMLPGFHPSMQRMAHLLPHGASAARPIAPSKGFLQWDPGATTSATFSSAIADRVSGAGEAGCDDEQSLEAVYRFLVDPDPYETITIEEGRAVLHGIDQTVLRQRADFLRPESLVLIVSLSDENDCSVDPMALGGQGWLNLQERSVDPQNARIGARYFLPPGTSACVANPNDECCVNCEMLPPPGCTQPPDDPRCQEDAAPSEDADQPLKLRCFDEKRQFGVEFLHPIERYVCAIQFDPSLCASEQRRRPDVTWRAGKVPNRSGDLVDNPLLSDLQGTGRPGRDPDLVFWAMIVGVPWQDIARDPYDLSQGYMSFDQLERERRWSVIVGDPTASPPIASTDPLMIESIEPRAGANPITGDPTVLPGDMGWNPINGRERDTSKRRDELQSACVFPPGSDAQGYPGTRHLEVARRLGAQAVVASVCPAELADPSAPDFGYRPAIDAILERVSPSLAKHCLPESLTANLSVPADDPTFGQIACSVLEVQPSAASSACRCDAPGRRPFAGDASRFTGCVCEIPQLAGADLRACRTREPGAGVDGWCYVDPAQGLGEPSLVSDCPPDERRDFRFVGAVPPADGAKAFISCDDSVFSSARGLGPR